MSNITLTQAKKSLKLLKEVRKELKETKAIIPGHAILGRVPLIKFTQCLHRAYNFPQIALYGGLTDKQQIAVFLKTPEGAKRDIKHKSQDLINLLKLYNI